MDTNSLVKLVDLEQGSTEWKEFRKGKIGSSMAASILGVGFKTPLQLFEDIIEDKETPVNEAMLRGIQMEPIARQCINEKYNSDLQPVVISHPKSDLDWHISSLDGFFVRQDGSIFVCEIKCPGMKDHQTALDGKIPEKYIPQLNHILEDLPTVDRILYFSYHPTSQAEVWFFRDQDALDTQLVKEQEFFNRVIDCKPPDPIDKDWVKVYEPRLCMRAEEYSEVCKQIVLLEAKKEELKKDLISGQHLRCQIGTVKIQKIIRSGSIDYSKIEELKTIDLDQYRKPKISTWRISI